KEIVPLEGFVILVISPSSSTLVAAYATEGVDAIIENTVVNASRKANTFLPLCIEAEKLTLFCLYA
ncbi:MAG: hypothetical protein KIC63_05985, partial [Clostridium sp.]|nr:hypothetical protein [Clostridium sp.]